MDSQLEKAYRIGLGRTVLPVFCLLLLASSPNGTARAQWTRTNWPQSKVIHALMVSEADLYGGSTAGIMRSTDDGASWSYPESTFSYRRGYSFASRGELLFAGTTTGLYRSTNRGRVWDRVEVGLSRPELSVYGIALLDSAIFIGTGGQGIAVSTDAGVLWQRLPDGLDLDVVEFLTALDSNLFASINSTKMIRSTDRGITWQRSDKGLPYNSVFGVEKVGNMYLALTMQGIYESSDTGTTWTPRKTTGLEGIISICLIESHGSLIMGTGSGVFVSRDSGYTWTNMSTGLDTIVNDVWILRVKGDFLYAAVYGYGLWRRPLSELTSVESPDLPVPVRHALLQNYPNPFNPSTTIRYGLPSREHVTLTVFNTLGQQVSTLVQGEQDPGYHEVRFDGANLPSGVYFYRMNASSYTETKKLLLVR